MVVQMVDAAGAQMPRQDQRLGRIGHLSEPAAQARRGRAPCEGQHPQQVFRPAERGQKRPGQGGRMAGCGEDVEGVAQGGAFGRPGDLAGRRPPHRTGVHREAQVAQPGDLAQDERVRHGGIERGQIGQSGSRGVWHAET